MDRHTGEGIFARKPPLRVVIVAVLLGACLVSALAISTALASISAGKALELANSLGRPEGESYWSSTLKHSGQIVLKSRILTVKQAGDELTARYVMTVEPSSLLVQDYIAAPINERNDLVTALLGEISVQQNANTWLPIDPWNQSLDFRASSLQVSNNLATISVDSNPIRLDLISYRVTVNPQTSTVKVTGRDELALHSSAVLGDIQGAAIIKTRGLDVSLVRHSGTVNVGMTGQGPAFLEAARVLGGSSLIVVGPALKRISSLAFYFIFLWSVTKVLAPRLQEVEIFRSSLRIIILGFSAMALFGLCVDVAGNQNTPMDYQNYIYSGPLGILMASVFVAWPVFPSGQSRTLMSRHQLARRELEVLLAVICSIIYFAAATFYIHTTLSRALLGSIAGAALYFILRLPAGLVGGRLKGALVATGATIIMLLTTMFWPYALYTTINGDENYVGKWIFLVGALFVVFGVARLISRTIKAFYSMRSQPGGIRRIWIEASLVSFLLVATVPSAVSVSEVFSPQKTGQSALGLFALTDGLMSWTDWAILAGTIPVLVALHRSHSFETTRRLLVALMIIVLFRNDTWLYVPITVGLGFLLIANLNLPRRDGNSSRPLRRNPYSAIRCWQDAAALEQESQILTADTISSRVQKIADGHASVEELGKERWKMREARLGIDSEMRERVRRAQIMRDIALGDRGGSPEPRMAVAGGIIGAILGIPLVTLAFMNYDVIFGDYPILDFMGSQAWSLSYWGMLGALVGYARPILRTSRGMFKVCLLVLVMTTAQLPFQILWGSASDWRLFELWIVQNAAFLVLLVMLLDIYTIVHAGLRVRDWIEVQNWRPFATFGTAALLAVGAAGSAFLVGAAGELSKLVVVSVVAPGSQGTQPPSITGTP
jgi:hypothetical protein